MTFISKLQVTIFDTGHKDCPGKDLNHNKTIKKNDVY